MSKFQEWLLRWIVNSSLGAMPYTASLFRIIREEAEGRWYEDNRVTVDAHLREAFDYSAPPAAIRKG